MAQSVQVMAMMSRFANLVKITHQVVAACEHAYRELALSTFS
jgi:hypothetical protein